MWKFVGKCLAKALVWAVAHPDTVKQIVDKAVEAKAARQKS